MAEDEGIMASYQAKHRDPLFDSNTQAVLERRGKELFGFGLLVIALMMGLILWSYVPEDPSWLSATDAPIRNFLWRFGASVASPLVVIAGVGAWGGVVVLTGWGFRFCCISAQNAQLRGLSLHRSRLR